MWDFIVDRKAQILINALNHAYLVILCVIFATFIAIALAVLVTRMPKLEPVANAVSAIGLTIPSFALVGLLLPVTGLGDGTALAAVTFYAVLPILRNAVVGLAGRRRQPARVRPWHGDERGRVAAAGADPAGVAGDPGRHPDLLQMSMGIAAIAAYVLGPGLGVSIFTGLAQIGGKNAVSYAAVGTVGIVIVALLLDALLLLPAALTTSKGIRV